MSKKISRLDSFSIFMALGSRGPLRWMDDKTYIQLLYQCRFHKKPDLNEPKTYNEKLQWLKLYDRRSEYTDLVDKYQVKKIVGPIIGEEHIIPTLGVWDSYDEIPFDELPDRFVLKCTHDSGGVVFIRDSHSFSREKVKKFLEKHLKSNYYWVGREWPYKNIKPRILAEEYLEDWEGSADLSDYKVHCFGGVPRLVQLLNGRFSDGETRNDFYTGNWERLALRRIGYGNALSPANRPDELPELLSLAKKLSNGIPYVRTDFYISKHKIYFGEMTFFPSSGFTPFVPETYDDLFGDWIILPPQSSAADGI